MGMYDDDPFQEGYRTGYRDGLEDARRDIGRDLGESRNARKSTPSPAKKTRKASPYQVRYGKEFKRLAPKYKLKRGGWAKDGFKRAQAAAHKATKKAMR